MHNKFERLTAQQKLSDMAPWTASGTRHLRSEAGHRRRKDSTDTRGEEMTRGVPNWVATNPTSPLYGTAVHTEGEGIRPRPSRWASWPPDVRLPADQATVDAAAFKWFGGSHHRLLQLLPDVLNVGPMLSPVTHVPEHALLSHALRGELLTQIWRCLLRPDGALDDVSTMLPKQPMATFRRPDPSAAARPWTRTSVVDPTAVGWRARQKAINPTAWTSPIADQSARLRRDTFQVHAPDAEDEMSALGQMSVQLKAALRHGFRHPGHFVGHAGDGRRPFLSTDVGTQEQREANIERLANIERRS